MEMYLSNSFGKLTKELFRRLFSLCCIVLTFWISISPLPALADNIPTSLKQTATGNITNNFNEGPSKEALVGALAGTAAGTAAGAVGSIAVISAAGTAGLSAAGITSGLATVGTIVGGGMAAGITVAAALPVLGAVAVGGVTYGVVSLAQRFVNDSKDSKQDNNQSQN
jgi:hypothetical protein